MPEFVRVRVKSTKAKIWVAEHELNDSVEVLEDQPAQPVGGYAPKAHKNVPSAPSTGKNEPIERVDGTEAGKSGTKKEGSK